MLLGNIQSIYYFVPELLLSFFIFIILFMDLLKIDQKVIYALAPLFLLITFMVQTNLDIRSVYLFEGILRYDALGVYFKYFTYIVLFVVVLISLSSNETNTKATTTFGFLPAEYLMLTFGLGIGMILLATSNNMLMTYLAIEFLSLLSYIATGFKFKNKKSNEASLKYVIYGGVASGIMIYGISFLYGMTGSLFYNSIGSFLTNQPTYNVTLFVSILFIYAGLGYKIATIPMHMWCPDVYEGAPTPVTALLSVGPKAAGFILALRLFYEVFSVNFQDITHINWPLFIAIISVFTMTLGNLVAIHQTNLKRLLAYSSIAHAGYVLMGIASISILGQQSVLFYLVVYMLMNFGAFLVVILISNRYGVEEIEDYRGLAWKTPYLGFIAVLMTIFLLSLTGLPPFAGFIGKFYLFSAVIEKGPSYYWLALAGVINSVISLYYYARIIKAMFLEEARTEIALVDGDTQVLGTAILSVLAFFTLLFGIYWGPVFEVITTIFASL